MAKQVDDVMRGLAERQHGLASRDQLRDRDVPRQAVARRIQSAEWTPVTPRVLRRTGMPKTAEQLAMAAVLDAGSGTVLSHRSAAALWGLPGFHLSPLEASRPRSGPKRTTRLARLHHPVALPGRHCTELRSIPVTTLVRTVFDLAGSVHPARCERALHSALRIGAQWRTIEDHLEELAEHGRPGIELMRQLIAEHGGLQPLGSGLEARLLRVLLEAGLPEPRRQIDLGAESWIGRVDFLYDDARLVIEVNGDWHHASALDVERDSRRTAGLVAAGFKVLHIPERLLRRDPGEVVRLVREARAQVA